MWIVWCLARFPPRVNCLPQTSQWYGFSLLWILWCLTRFPLSVNFLPHTSQWYGFSLLWILWCLTRLPLSVNFLPHTSQWYSFSLLCILWCLTRSPLWVNCLPQTSHWYGFSLLWSLLCLYRFDLFAKCLSQWWHWYNELPVSTLLYDWFVLKLGSHSSGTSSFITSINPSTVFTSCLICSRWSMLQCSEQCWNNVLLIWLDRNNWLSQAVLSLNTLMSGDFVTKGYFCQGRLINKGCKSSYLNKKIKIES